MNRQQLERQLAALPLSDYAFFPTQTLEFSERIRTVCETQCPRFGKSWACPPAVGTLAACRARCLSYPQALLISSLSEVDDITELEQALAARAQHEALTREVARLLRAHSEAVYPLSTDSCAVCRRCTYPHAPCRYPEKMYPCVESHGIIVTALAERCGIDYQAGGNLITWFSLLLYR